MHDAYAGERLREREKGNEKERWREERREGERVFLFGFHVFAKPTPTLLLDSSFAASSSSLCCFPLSKQSICKLTAIFNESSIIRPTLASSPLLLQLRWLLLSAAAPDSHGLWSTREHRQRGKGNSGPTAADGLLGCAKGCLPFRLISPVNGPLFSDGFVYPFSIITGGCLKRREQRRVSEREREREACS